MTKCRNCGAEVGGRAAFCPDCGSALGPRPANGRARSRLIERFAPALPLFLALLVAIAAVVWAVVRNGGSPASGPGSTHSDPLPAVDRIPPPDHVSADVESNLRAAVVALPETRATGDRDQLRALLGPPDVFILEFLPNSGGGTQRLETWHYLDLGVSYEIVDGELLFTFPMNEVPELLLVPLRFDPADFKENTSLADIRAMLADPQSLVRQDPPPEYGVDITIWTGELLTVAFDASGALFYVETVPLGPGGGEP